MGEKGAYLDEHEHFFADSLEVEKPAINTPVHANVCTDFKVCTDFNTGKEILTDGEAVEPNSIGIFSSESEEIEAGKELCVDDAAVLPIEDFVAVAADENLKEW